jgi:hypothetical protein
LRLSSHGLRVSISVDNWTEYPVGALLLSVPGTWKVYSSLKVFKDPPTVVLDDARRALRLKTDHETMAIGRSFHLDVATTRTLLWEWKPLVHIFGDEPAPLVAVTLESHSDDVASESAVLFRRVRFQAR